VAEIYAALSPSVVSIEARNGTTGSRGTGVIVNADASILTALHVVNGATEIRVLFADGTQSSAAIVTADPAMDIALLAPVALPSLVVPAVLGGGLAVGETVIAIGDQLGLAQSTTVGVVSGLDRTAPGEGGATLPGLIQFDAAVNHGSSGGPLVNTRGETVGIVVALANPTDAGTFIGIGFAVPIGMAVAAGDGQQIPQ
jgi:S1-C subfamily serine protease